MSKGDKYVIGLALIVVCIGILLSSCQVEAEGPKDCKLEGTCEATKEYKVTPTKEPKPTATRLPTATPTATATLVPTPTLTPFPTPTRLPSVATPDIVGPIGGYDVLYYGYLNRDANMRDGEGRYVITLPVRSALSVAEEAEYLGAYAPTIEGNWCLTEPVSEDLWVACYLITKEN